MALSLKSKRQKTAGGPTAKTNWKLSPQIEGLAYNVNGYALVPPKPFDSRNVVYINARAESSTPYLKALKEGIKARVAGLSDSENAPEPPPNTYQYLLVGFVPRDLEERFGKVRASYLTNSMPVGVKEPGEADMVQYKEEDEGECPLLAVVKVTDDEETAAKLSTYVLLDAKDDMSTPYVVPQPHIFYLSTFRDNSTDRHKRPSQWNIKVREYCVRDTNRPKTEKALRYQRAKDQSKLILPPSLALRNEVTSLVLGYKGSQDAWLLAELQTVLEEVDSDLLLRPVEKTAMQIFGLPEDDETGSGDSFDFNQAEKMVEEVRIVRPDLACSPEQLFLLHYGVVAANLAIDYEKLIPFLAEALHNLKEAVENDRVSTNYAFGGELESHAEDAEGKNSSRPVYNGQEDDGVAILAEQALQTITRVLGYQAPVPVPVTAEGAVLDVVKNKLKDIVALDDTFGAMVKDATGDQVFDTTIQDIWGHFADSCDTDDARAAFMDVVRLLVCAFRQKNRHLATCVQRIVEILEKSGY